MLWAISTLLTYLEHRQADLLTAGELVQQLIIPGKQLNTAQLTPKVVASTAAALLLVQTLLILVTGIGRKQLLAALETVVASILLLLLILIVLGLPVGMHPLQCSCLLHS